MDDSGTLRVKAFDGQCDRIFAAVYVGEVYVTRFYYEAFCLC